MNNPIQGKEKNVQYKKAIITLVNQE